jgi:hypothetical protein
MACSGTALALRQYKLQQLAVVNADGRIFKSHFPYADVTSDAYICEVGIRGTGCDVSQFIRETRHHSSHTEHAQEKI